MAKHKGRYSYTRVYGVQMPELAKFEEDNLYYKEGSSDKVYNAWIEGPTPSGRYHVGFSYGRRGNTLQYGTKINNASLATAKSVKSNLISTKTNKGYKYTVGLARVRQEATSKAEVSGPAKVPFGDPPQLLNFITEERTMELLNDNDYWMMEKKDGKRYKIRREDKKNVGGNKLDIVIPIPAEVSEEVSKLGYDQLGLDGEMIGDKYHLFDLTKVDSQDLKDRPFYSRYGDLETFKYTIEEKGLKHLEVLEVYATSKQKREAFARLKKERAEGVVFIKKDAPYSAGRPNSGGDRLKFKFTASATCKVAAITPGKRSVSLELRDGNKPIIMGNCTVLPNFKMPSIGAFIEVKYLCAYKNGSLREPVYLGERDDQNICDDISTLKYKQETADEDE